MPCHDCPTKSVFKCKTCCRHLCQPCFYETYVVENYPPCKITRFCAFCNVHFSKDVIAKIFCNTIDWHSCDNFLIGGKYRKAIAYSKIDTICMSQTLANNFCQCNRRITRAFQRTIHEGDHCPTCFLRIKPDHDSQLSVDSENVNDVEDINVAPQSPFNSFDSTSDYNSPIHQYVNLRDFRGHLRFSTSSDELYTYIHSHYINK